LDLQQRNPPEKAPRTVKLEKNKALSLLRLLKTQEPVREYASTCSMSVQKKVVVLAA